MISESVARRYIKSLFEVAREEKQADALAPVLQGLQSLYLERADLRAVLMNPRLPDARKRAVLLGLVGDNPPELLQRFLDLLLAKRRIDVLRYAGLVYQELLDEAAGVRHAQVVAAFPLDQAQERQLGEVLSRKLGATVTVESRVDPAVIGGLMVKVGDLLIDGTIRRRLEQLRDRVTGARV